MTEINKKPEVPKDLKRWGYDWVPINQEFVKEDIGKILEKNKAQCYLIDMYTTGNQVFRNVICTLEEFPEVESDLTYRYNRETGKQFAISKRVK